ncbi:MAG: DUF1298 domain-containing protein [Candidatus Hydrogenedentes bacterium]|nr:DUF1298 domain-containing protein [Candidatus Hydrogenedentota bacterium]
MGESERLLARDAALLHFVSELGFGHTGSTNIVDGELSFEEFSRDLEAKVQNLPRFRQRPVFVPLNLAYPTWEYDPDFAFANHVDHVRLDPPGSWEQVLAATADFHSVALPTDRPYWFARLLTGLEGNQSAILFKVHHAVMDGVGAEAFQRVIFEEDAPQPIPPAPVPPLPNAATRLWRGLRDNALTGINVAVHFPANTVGLVRWLMSNDSREYFRIRRAFNRADGLRFPFNTPSSGRIRIATTRFLLEDLRALGRACDATINDVLLGTIGRAVQHYAKMRNIDTRGKVMKVSIPVNMRQEGEARNMGNIATLAPVPIPLDVENPRDLVRNVSNYMRALKQCRYPLATHRAIGAILFCMSPVLAPIVQRTVASVAMQRKSMAPGKKVGAVMVVSNVPRKPAPLRIANRPVLMRYPVGGTTPHIGIGCVAMTCGPYLGVTFAVNHTAADELKPLMQLIETSYDELRASAAAPSA